MNTAEIIEGILEHHGVKGQKWGVRKARNSSSNVTVLDKKKKLKTYGGKGRPAHSDAVRARTIGQVAKKSGHKALSNEELRAYNERLNLEQNAKRLSQADLSPGRKFVNTLLLKNAPKAPGAVYKNRGKIKRTMATGAAALALA